MEYYSLEPALSRGAKLVFVTGHRSAGKTYAFKEWAMKTYLANGKEWVYIRRAQDELNSVKGTLWDDIAFKFDKEIKTKGSQCFIRDLPPEELEGKELNQWKSENPWKKFGYYIPLSQQQNFKSASFPNVDKICFDEFIIENTRKQYLPNEVEQLLSLIFTISRDRSVKTVCLSNSGFINNPYFSYYGIRSNEFNNASFIRKNKGNVLFEYYTNKNNLEELQSSTIAHISNSEYKQYALENKFKDGGEDLIQQIKPINATPMMKFTVDGKEFLSVYYKPGENYWVCNKNINGLQAYSLKNWSTSIDAPYNIQMIRNMKALMDNRMILFQTADVREKFLKWLRET